MIFIRRSKTSLAHLEWRIRLFGVGAILAMVGIWADQRWLVNVAIIVLLVGFGLRLLRARPEPDAESPEEQPPP